jgi:hypothetical protein
MNVLEIYPNFSWWFEGAAESEIEQLRSAAQIDSLSEQADAFEKLAPARAFHLVGDAATLDLIPGVFDQIIVHYIPTALKRMVLESHMRDWLRPTGTIRFQPDFLNEPENEESRPLRPYFKVH